MKKRTIFMTIFLTAICVLFGMNNVNALVYDSDNIDLSNISSLAGYSSHYIVTGTYYKSSGGATPDYNTTSRLYLLFTPATVYYDVQTSIAGYLNPTCQSQNSCFSRITTNTTASSTPRMYQYYSDNGGATWTFFANSSSFSPGGTYSNGYTIEINNVNTYQYYNTSTRVFSSNYYWLVFLPSYLQGYTRISLTANDRYYMLSDISSGSVFIPYNDFFDYGGRLSYYDNDLDYQSYSSYIQDYTIMEDKKFVRQDFNIENYPGADFVQFSKYIYLEGEDNVSYDIFVPSSAYGSYVTITPNQQGGNDFTFDYKDSNGDIQQGSTSSVSSGNPLLPVFLQDFSTNTFGLTSIIVAPLNLISSLLSQNCISINVPLPFVNSSISLPCMSTFYSSVLGNWFTTYQYVTFGLVSYWVIIRIFNMIKDFKNPDHDEIEVLDV